jgi:hypothetical protein
MTATGQTRKIAVLRSHVSFTSERRRGVGPPVGSELCQNLTPAPQHICRQARQRLSLGTHDIELECAANERIGRRRDPEFGTLPDDGPRQPR